MTFYSKELSNIGKIITLGSLNLSLTLRLEKSDFQLLGIEFKNINALKDLTFILENEYLWERIELITESELLNTLFHMNRIKKIKNIVAYLIYNKIEFNEEQIKFQRLLDFLLLTYGVVIYSYDICKCKINIFFNIIYKNTSKKIIIYEEDVLYTNKDNDTNKDNLENKDKHEKKEENGEEINDENEKEDMGLFGRIPENQVNFDDFKYIYIHFSDYTIGGELFEIFKLKELYYFLKHIKNETKTKIIINFGENLKSYEKYLISFIKVSDIHIFRNKVELVDILMKKKEKEDKKKQKINQKFLQIFKAQNNHKIKKIKAVMHRDGSKKSLNSNLSFSKISKNSGDNKTNNSYTSRKLEYKSQTLKNMLINKSLNISLNIKSKDYFNKNNIFNYIQELIYNPTEFMENQNQNDKLGIYIDDFKKIYIIDYKKLRFKPNISEYDLNIYPKPNIHNLLEIENIKNILHSNNSLLSYIIYGCILITILDDMSKSNDNYYLFYFYIRMSILKILSVIKNGMKIPTDKEFYLIELKKNELNKIITDENTKRKEEGFNISFFNSEHKTKSENSIDEKDKFGTLYMQGFRKKENLKTKSIINNYKTNEKTFLNFIKKRNTNLEKGFWTKRKNMKFSFHSNRVPDLSVYLSKEQKQKLTKENKLPPLRFISKSSNQTSNSFMKSKIPKLDIRKNENNKNSQEEGKIDISKYKEIKFQPTQKEKEN